MIINLEDLIKKYNLNIKGVIHIGANVGQEISTYNKLNINERIYIEPQTNIFEKLKSSSRDEDLLFNTALGNQIGEIEMFISDNLNSQSSSILKPDLHLTLHPNCKFPDKSIVKITKLDLLEFDRKKYNFINIDVQGYELEVLKGGSETINHIDYIYSEVNRDSVYKGCPHIDELESFLKPYGFYLAEVYWATKHWGDALFIKN